MWRVVEADGFEGHASKMVSLKLFEELKLISGMLRARIRDVLEVAGELILRIYLCCHFPRLVCFL